MDEINARILLGILKRELIREIAKAVGLSQSTVHDRMTWLRDQGYIEPWPEGKAAGKSLTELGRNAVRAMYGEEAFKL